MHENDKTAVVSRASPLNNRSRSPPLSSSHENDAVQDTSPKSVASSKNARSIWCFASNVDAMTPLSLMCGITSSGSSDQLVGAH